MGAVQAIISRRSQTESLKSHITRHACSAGKAATAFASRLPREKEDSRVIRPARKSSITPRFEAKFGMVRRGLRSR